jgi:hypothetical protein
MKLSGLTRDYALIEAPMILALIVSLGMLLGCELCILPVSSPAGSLDGLRPINLVSLDSLIRVPFLPIPPRAPAGIDLIEGVAEEEEEEDSPELGKGAATAIASFGLLDVPHPALLSSCRRRETTLPRHWPSPQLRC